jgi:hypothetical protein
MVIPAASAAYQRVEPRTGPEGLRDQYQAYRTRQARKLVRMLPTVAVRPLYRAALADVGARPGERDAVALLVRYCERMLPLPPFEVWLEDATLHAASHLDDLDDAADAPSARAPASIDDRPFEYRRETWVAHLRGFRDGDAWRGYITFERPGAPPLHHTSLIFRETTPTDLLARFSSFDEGALEAFLRSALP